MFILYHIFLVLYRAAIAITALWNSKARAWKQGRLGQWVDLRQHIPPVVKEQKRFWMHCASLGEFEQGRPILEALKAKDPDCVIILSFFSPSGYSVRKGWKGADYVCYLPMDGRRSAKRFLDIVQPKLALFVKYEFWHFYLKELHTRHIPTVLVSGAFRQSQPFFQWWGGFFRKMLSRFSLLTVQDIQSLRLLQGIELGTKTYLTGDTRFDRVAQIAAESENLPLIETFKGTGKLVIAGSTWPADERMLHAALSTIPDNWKLIIAPHEIDPAHLSHIKALFKEDCILYSAMKSNTTARILVIDSMGILSSLYRYGEIACVGGGYNRSGIHNVLEPAVFGLPVIMGPEYKKFGEAVQMVKKGFAFPATDEKAYTDMLHVLTRDAEGLNTLQGFIRNYIHEHTGATAKILSLISVAS